MYGYATLSSLKGKLAIVKSGSQKRRIIFVRPRDLPLDLVIECSYLDHEGKGHGPSYSVKFRTYWPVFLKNDLARRIQLITKTGGTSSSSSSINISVLWRSYLKTTRFVDHRVSYAQWCRLEIKEYNLFQSHHNLHSLIQFSFIVRDLSIDKSTLLRLCTEFEFFSTSLKSGQDYLRLSSSEQLIIYEPSSRSFFIVNSSIDAVIDINRLAFLLEMQLVDDRHCIYYWDEDRIDEEGVRSFPYFKTAWDSYLFKADDDFIPIYSLRLDLVLLNESDLLCSLLNYSSGLSMIIELLPHPFSIVHVPLVISHRLTREVNTNFCQTLPFSLSRPEPRKADIAKVVAGLNCSLTVVIPTKNCTTILKKCINGLLHDTDLDSISLSVVVVNNGSTDHDCLAYLALLRRVPFIRVIDSPGAFNYSKLCNIGAAGCGSDVLLFLNNDIEVLSSDWLQILLRTVVRSDVGCVGAKLLYPNMTIQHAGIVFGLGGVAGHVHSRMSGMSDHYYCGLHMFTRNVTAVTGAVLAIRTKIFDFLGGFNEVSLPINYNDVDLCIRARELGLSNIYCADAILIHHESLSRGKSLKGQKLYRWRAEAKYLLETWEEKYGRDAYYSPNLSLANSQLFFAEPSFPLLVRSVLIP
ncbi:glycosyltransferase [Cyanobium sp. Morenito 9A2]|nr:glycosyltransferase [Cyanobium sp. Morenito 9A2]